MYLYPAIQERFQQRQIDLREARDALLKAFTLAAATRRVADLRPQVKRLEETSKLLLDQFRRRQYNAFANNVPMDLLARDKPLPERRERKSKRLAPDRRGGPEHASTQIRK